MGSAYSNTMDEKRTQEIVCAQINILKKNAVKYKIINKNNGAYSFSR